MVWVRGWAPICCEYSFGQATCVILHTSGSRYWGEVRNAICLLWVMPVNDKWGGKRVRASLGLWCGSDRMQPAWDLGGQIAHWKSDMWFEVVRPSTPGARLLAQGYSGRVWLQLECQSGSWRGCSWKLTATSTPLLWRDVGVVHFLWELVFNLKRGDTENCKTFWQEHSIQTPALRDLT